MPTVYADIILQATGCSPNDVEAIEKLNARCDLPLYTGLANARRARGRRPRGVAGALTDEARGRPECTGPSVVAKTLPATNRSAISGSR